MTSKINELWIFSKSGVTLVNYKKDPGLKLSLFPPFMAAVQTMLKESTNKTLESFSMSNNKFTCNSCLDHNVLLVSRSPIKAKDKKIYKILDNVRIELETTFTADDIKNWDGNLAYFKKFKEQLKNLL